MGPQPTAASARLPHHVQKHPKVLITTERHPSNPAIGSGVETATKQRYGDMGKREELGEATNRRMKTSTTRDWIALRDAASRTSGQNMLTTASEYARTPT